MVSGSMEYVGRKNASALPVLQLAGTEAMAHVEMAIHTTPTKPLFPVCKVPAIVESHGYYLAILLEDDAISLEVQ